MRRFFIPGLIADELVISGDDAHHIINVLRYKIGKKLIVVDAAQNIAETEIVEIGSDWIKAACIARLDGNTEALVEVILAQCLPKSDKMDFIVQKAVELGVSAIYPVVSENCVVKYDDAKKAARRQKWQKIAHEAAKQCGRTVVPEVASIVSLRELAATIGDDTEVLFCYEQEENRALKTLLESSAAGRFLLLIGPEGGFTPSEAAFCQERGFHSVTLGPRILRAETAAIAAVSVVMYQNGDLGGRR